MRGEKAISFASPKMVIGSPPHARGKVTNPNAAFIPVGITPACAGKSKNCLSEDDIAEDHPRMRGEKSQSRRLWRSLPGSPPHARGKVLCSVVFAF